MGDSQNWRTQVDAQDFFGFSKKASAMVERRPVLKKASQLVGPGIGAASVLISDFNDILATYDGYYSALSTALNAPTAVEAFIGTVIMDSTLGGVQEFTGLTTGIKYTRIFLRNPSDASSITFGAWTHQERGIVAATFNSSNPTTVPTSTSVTYLNMPAIVTSDGTTNTFNVSGVSLLVKRTGVYTGYLIVDTATAAVTGLFTTLFQHPDRASHVVETQAGGGIQFDQYNPIRVPFTFYATFTGGSVRAAVAQNVTATSVITITGLQIARIGDLPS